MVTAVVKRVTLLEKRHILKNIITISLMILSILVPMITGGCKNGEQELLEITAKEAASLALEFGRQGMEDAEVLRVSSHQYFKEIENGQAEGWDIELGSQSSGLEAELAVKADATIYLGHTDYKHLDDKYPSYKPHDIPASAVVPNEAWKEDEIMGREYIRKRCTENAETWLDSPEIEGIASTHAREWYNNRENEDFSDTYISQMTFYGDKWVVRFSPYKNANSRSYVEVTLDPNGNLIEVERTHIRIG